LVSVRFILEKW